MDIKKTNIKIETYQITENFFVDAQTNMEYEEYTDFFLYHKGYSIKACVIGIEIDDLKRMWGYTTMEEVIKHLINEDDLYCYYEEYIKDSFINEEDARKQIEDDFNIFDYEY